MDRRNQLGTALVGLAVVLFVIPAFFPVQPMLTHDTRHTVPLGPDDLREEGFEIVSYGNLSDRGQELYVRTLESGGSYRVAPGTGAPDFEYPTDAERRAAFEEGPSERPGNVVIERPRNDGDLPAADERLYGEPRDGENRTQQRERVLRYDSMETGMEQPPLGSPAQLARLLAALLAVLSLGVGGYLLSSR